MNISTNLSMNVSIWRRLLAFIFDILVINLVIAWPFQSALKNYTFKNITIHSIFPAEAYFIVFMIFILALLYFTFLEYYVGQTPGQMLMNIKSISNDGNMSFWKAFVRNIFILPFFPFYILWVLEPIYLVFYKQRFLEKITNTDTVMSGVNIVPQKYNLKKVE